MAVTNIPNVQNWTVTPQNGQTGYFTLMNTWLGQSTLVIASLQTAIAATNTANNEINNLAIQTENNAIIATGLANFQGTWNNIATYSKGQSVESTMGSKIYYTSKVDNNLNHAVTDTTYWLYNPINDKLEKDFSTFTTKSTPIDTDILPIMEVDKTLKYLSWANLKATLLGVRRNYLINGNFKINERGYVSGTATTVANQYILDRWYIPTIGQSATFTETNGIVTITAPYSGICQKIENISNNGLTRTISYSGTATLTVTESSDNITYTPITLTGKTFTPTSGKYVKITLSNGTVSLIKDEDGSVATDGWHPYDGEFGGEFQACERYCERGGNKLYISYPTSTKSICTAFRTTKRIPPTITFSGSNPPTSVELTTVNYFNSIRAIDDYEISFSFIALAEL